MRQIVIRPDIDEGRGYVVDVPTLPGCHTWGETIDEAVTMAQDAIRCWTEARLDIGDPVPDEDFAALIVCVEELPLRKPTQLSARSS